MRKLKLLPTVLMLVLCVGVLAIGVWAITPSKNTITGTITIGAVPAEVQIDCYIGDSTGTPTSFPSVRTGMTWAPQLNLSTGTANTANEIPEYELTIKITNKSDKELGVYFLQGELADDGFATGANVRTEATLTERDLVDDEGNYIDAEKADPKDLVDFKFDVYKYIAPKTDEAGKVVEMKMYYKCADFIDVDGKVKFNYYLNIEEYKPNVGTAEELAAGTVEYAANPSTYTYTKDQWDAYTFTQQSNGANSVTTDFVKLSKSITAITGAEIYYRYDEENSVFLPVINAGVTFFNNTNIKYVIGTNKLTSVGSTLEVSWAIGTDFIVENASSVSNPDYMMMERPFKGCTNLEWCSFNNVSWYGFEAFIGCTKLQYVTLSNCTVSYKAFANCTSLKDVIVDDFVTFKSCTLSNGNIGEDTLFANQFDGSNINTLVYKSEPEGCVNTFANCTISNVRTNVTTEEYTLVNGVYTMTGASTVLTGSPMLAPYIKEMNVQNTLTEVPAGVLYGIADVSVFTLPQAPEGKMWVCCNWYDGMEWYYEATQAAINDCLTTDTPAANQGGTDRSYWKRIILVDETITIDGGDYVYSNGVITCNGSNLMVPYLIANLATKIVATSSVTSIDSSAFWAINNKDKVKVIDLSAANVTEFEQWCLNGFDTSKTQIILPKAMQN